MTTSTPDLIVLHEHPEWQKPLFAALQRRGVPFAPFDVTRAAFSNVEPPRARLYFNQASPSAYIRGNTRAVPLALAYMRSLELLGARVLNGAEVFALELSKSAQATLLRRLGIDCPRSITFNDVAALRRYEHDVRWPALLKPDQGGSGARIQVVNSLAEVEASSPPIRTCGCPTICSCCRSTCRTIPAAASSAWSSLTASCCTRCGSSRTDTSTCARHPSAILRKTPARVTRRRIRRSRRRRWSFIRSLRCRETRWRWRSGSCARPGSMSAASSISKQTVAGACSTTSMPTRTCAR